MSTTPRTDEQTLAYRSEDGSAMVHASFAAELETELTRLRDEVERLRKRNELLTDHYECKMNIPERVSNIETELTAMQDRAEKAEAESLEQARLLGLSGNEVAALRGTVFRLSSLWHQLFFLLDTIEESDSGNAFKPNYFSSCRIADAESMEKILTKAKHELNAGVNKQDL